MHADSYSRLPPLVLPGPVMVPHLYPNHPQTQCLAVGHHPLPPWLFFLQERSQLIDSPRAFRAATKVAPPFGCSSSQPARLNGARGRPSPFKYVGACVSWVGFSFECG